MNLVTRCCTTALSALVMIMSLPASTAWAGGGGHGGYGHGGYGGGHYGGGHGGGYYRGGHGSHWGGLGWGLGIGAGLGWLGARQFYGARSDQNRIYESRIYGGNVYGPGYSEYSSYGSPDYVVVEPPVIYREAPRRVYREVPRSVYREVPAPVYAPPARPDPIIYPRNAQSAVQTEADRQACNRWATTQSNAMNDSSVFNRATEACMDGRGYTLR